ncbi:RsmE family RNA methyltransferase, partial [Francisella tularensis]|uniref:RsmE family RNA methyltransferase n=1 Tax=Francisella tularensis TaxID=263 RepID=UPI002381C119
VKSSTNFNIFIGPDGGFSDKEMRKFHSNNFYTINLVKRILKAETAPINILSIIKFLKQ